MLISAFGNEMLELKLITPPKPTRGQSVFAVCFLGFALVLFLLLPYQTTRVESATWHTQPGFWPIISITGMVIFGVFHLWRLPRRKFEKMDLKEATLWVRGFEFVLWFMAYVLLVPLIGYLPSTLIFVLPMIYRQGYRRPFYFYCGALFVFAVVVFFKVLLEVKIPGAALYEMFPENVRNFLILNF